MVRTHLSPEGDKTTNRRSYPLSLASGVPSGPRRPVPDSTAEAQLAMGGALKTWPTTSDARGRPAAVPLRLGDNRPADVDRKQPKRRTDRRALSEDLGLGCPGHSVAPVRNDDNRGSP